MIAGDLAPAAAATNAARRWHIVVAGPLATADAAGLLHEGARSGLPRGYDGAPLLVTLVEGLLALGHRVTAITLSSDLPLRRGFTVSAQGPGFTLVYCPMRPRAWPPNGWRPGRIVDLYAFERHALEAAIRRAAPDLVHAHWAYEFAWAALASGRPHLVTSHDSPFTIARFYKGWRLAGYRWLRALMARHVLASARRVSTVSPYMVEQIQALCRVAVDVVPNPVAGSVFARRRRPEPGRCRILMVCNGWGARKNAEPALRAFDQLSRRRPEAELVLLGQDFGAGEAAARWWAAQGLAGRVQFVGALPYTQVLDWMACCDLLLHPSLEESFGAVVAEAMAVGLPVVAGRDSGAVPWVVGDDGVLVDVRSPAAIAAALDTLLGDAAARERIGRGARDAVARRFSAAGVVAQYVALYERVVAQRAAA